MVGSAFPPPSPPTGSRAASESALVVNGVSAPAAPTARTAVRDTTFRRTAGELVGVAGVSGNGQTELLDAVLGLRSLLER